MKTKFSRKLILDAALEEIVGGDGSVIHTFTIPEGPMAGVYSPPGILPNGGSGGVTPTDNGCVLSNQCSVGHTCDLSHC